MFTIFVFRRYGLAVPVAFFLVGLLLQVGLNKTGAADGLWVVGVDLFLTGVICAAISCAVTDNAPSTTAAYKSLLEGDMEEAGSDCRDSLEHFCTDDSSEDMFCYIPLNRCSVALMALGFAFIGVDLIMPKDA